MIEDSLKFPAKGDDVLKRYLIITALAFGSFLIIPAFTLVGYMMEFAGKFARGAREPPEFGQWGSLTIKGLVAGVIVLGYILIPLIVFMALAVGVGVGSTASTGFSAVLIGVGLVLYLLLAYLVPAGIAAYAVEEKAGAAFNLSKLKNTVVNSEYFIAFLVSIVLQIALQLVVWLASITVVGIVLVPALSAYVSLAMYALFAKVYANANGVSGTDGFDGGATDSDVVTSL